MCGPDVEIVDGLNQLCAATYLETSGSYLQTKYCSCLNQGHLSTVCADWKIIVTPRQIFALHLKYLQADVKYLLLQVQVQHSFQKCNFAG